MVYITKKIDRHNVIAIKSPMTSFTKVEKNNPKIPIEAWKALATQRNPEQNKHCWRQQNTWFQSFYLVIAAETLWYRHKVSCTDQYDQTDSPKETHKERATRFSTKMPTTYTKEKTGYTHVCLRTASVPFHRVQQQDGGADVREEEACGWWVIKAE